MAAKIFLVLAIFAAVAYAADTDCKCDPPSDLENSALWNFLKKLSEEEPDRNDLQQDRLDAVLPAVLSPLLECNCLQDKARRKRKVMPEVSSEESYSNVSEESVPERGDPKCPQGYVWLGILCAREEFILEK